MTTFHSRQSGDARRTRKNENADTFNFASQIAPSICAVMHTKHDKRGATIFKSLCKRTAVSKCFYMVSGKDAALPPRPPLRTGREGCPFIRLKPLQNSA